MLLCLRMVPGLWDFPRPPELLGSPHALQTGVLWVFSGKSLDLSRYLEFSRISKIIWVFSRSLGFWIFTVALGFSDPPKLLGFSSTFLILWICVRSQLFGLSSLHAKFPQAPRSLDFPRKAQCTDQAESKSSRCSPAFQMCGPSFQIYRFWVPGSMVFWLFDVIILMTPLEWKICIFPRPSGLWVSNTH